MEVLMRADRRMGVGSRWRTVGVLRAVAVAAAAHLAACPELETPLATVTGRIVGASPGAYAYPLGRPDLKVSVAVAEDWTFRLEGVPTSAGAFILYDGAPFPNGRAERVVLELAGGEENRMADRFGAGASVDDVLRMPLAGAVIAAALPEGGATAIGPAYSVVETDHTDLVPATGEEAIAIYPLPAGSFDVTARLAGFVSRRVTVEVASGATMAVALALEVDTASPAPGCGYALACDNDLHCETADGRCYACTSTAGCGPGETCATSVGLCQPPPGTSAGATCAACTGTADCVSAACVVPGDSLVGYCSRGCATDADCQAGFACDTTSGLCTAPFGCDDWLQTMGAPCLDDADCDDLSGGRCEHLPDQPGYCTAACTFDADCRVGAGSAAFTCVGGYCTP
jgi:hypothetical protein